MDIAFRILHEQQTSNDNKQKKEKKRRKMQDLNLSTESTTEDDDIEGLGNDAVEVRAKIPFETPNRKIERLYQYSFTKFMSLKYYMHLILNDIMYSPVEHFNM